MKKTILISIIFCLLFINAVFSTTREVVPFLLISPGARPAGMGQSYVAIADDGFAPYWNPAGLGFLESKHNLSTMYSPWLYDVFDDINFTFISYATQLKDWGTFGVFVPIMSYGTIPRTDNTGNSVGDIKPYDMAFNFLSYGKKVKENLSIGFNAKVIYSSFYNQGIDPSANKETGFTGALDFGIIKKNLKFKNLSFGASLSNIGPGMSYIDKESAPLPRLFRTGLAYNKRVIGWAHLTVSGEYRKLLIDWTKGDRAQYDAKERGTFGKMWDEMMESQYGLGLEFAYYNSALPILSFRGGYYKDKEGLKGPDGDGYVKGLTYGLGAEYVIEKIHTTIGLDFADVPGGKLQPSGQKIFSFNVKW